MHHEQLDVWNQAVDLATDIYRITRTFPDDEKFCLVSQMRRAAVSIASNIAEGAARQGPREFLQFLSIASGSSSELGTQLVIAGKVGLGVKADLKELQQRTVKISMMLQGLMKSIRQREHK